jgi:small subunit ribosomal protein S7
MVNGKMERGELAEKDGQERLRNIHFSDSSSKAASNCSEILSYMGGLDDEQKQLIKKLINFRMKEGKRTRVRPIVYKTFHRPARTERDVIKLMVDAIENIKPICEVEKVRVAGTIYDVPGIVARGRQQTLAIRWILEAAFKRRISYRISLEKCSFAEILDAYRKRGIARKKRGDLHGLASTNRSFAHFRWW